MARSTVLYVEDEENDAFFMRLAFKRSATGRQLEVVPDGKQALAYLSGEGRYSDREQHPLPELVLLDLNLPLISGFEVLAWMRTQPGLSSVPVIIFSSSGRQEEQARARNLGANHYIVKPTSGRQFVEIVHDLVGRWLAAAPETRLSPDATGGAAAAS